MTIHESFPEIQLCNFRYDMCRRRDGGRCSRGTAGRSPLKQPQVYLLTPSLYRNKKDFNRLDKTDETYPMNIKYIKSR